MPTTHSNCSAAVPSESTAVSSSPKPFGPWRLLECVGQGAATEVFAACDWEGDWSISPYCVKRLAPAFRRNPQAIEALQREAFVLSKVQHPNLLALLESQIDSPPFWIATAKLNAVTLRTFVGKPLDAVVALWFVRQTAEALVALHSQKWRHGDVKPENVLVGPEGHVTLVDLGFAERFGKRSIYELQASPQYAAPELFVADEPSSGASDIFALGVVLFELFAGRPPFQAESAAELIEAMAQHPTPDLRQFRPSLSNQVTQLVRRMLAKQPVRRPTADELVDALVNLEIELFDQRAEVAG